MQVRRIAWVGVRTESYDATVRFLRDVLGLKPAFQEPTTAELPPHRLGPVSGPVTADVPATERTPGTGRHG